MSMYSKMKKNIAYYYNNLTDQYSDKYVKQATIGFFLLAAFFGVYFLNNWYKTNREQKAFEAITEVIHSYNQAHQTVMGLDSVKDKEKIEQAWVDVVILLDALYKEHAGSYLAPVFLQYKSQVVLQKDHNVDHAFEILQSAIAACPKTSTIASILNMARIKMGFDVSDSQQQERSLNDLKELAKDTKNVCYQEALYTLGNYYVSVNQIAQAQDTWKELINTADDAPLFKSVWVKLAQQKLGLAS